MRRSGLINPALVAAVARLGHTQTFVVADCGLPIPRGMEVIDLSVTFGTPRFADVLHAILDEVVAEGATVAEEVRGLEAERWVTERLPAVAYVPHEELKRLVAEAQFVVRTGEATPYANVIVRCGVPF